MTKAPSRKPLISGNWKMHHNHFEALQLVQKLSYLITQEDHDAVEVSVHPQTGAIIVRTSVRYLEGGKVTKRFRQLSADLIRRRAKLYRELAK